jgi:hypothetical protein
MHADTQVSWQKLVLSRSHLWLALIQDLSDFSCISRPSRTGILPTLNVNGEPLILHSYYPMGPSHARANVRIAMRNMAIFFGAKFGMIHCLRTSENSPIALMR